MVGRPLGWRATIECCDHRAGGTSSIKSLPGYSKCTMLDQQPGTLEASCSEVMRTSLAGGMSPMSTRARSSGLCASFRLNSRVLYLFL